MTDRYIDQDETKYYGPYTAREIRKQVKGLIPAVDAGLEELAVRIETATAAVESAVGQARGADAGKRKGSRDKKPVLGKAKDVIRRFSKHLDTHAKGTVDRKVFFVRDGTVEGAGGAATDVLLALGHVTGELGKPGTPVKNAADWKAEMEVVIAELAPAIEHSTDAGTDRSDATPAVEAARAAWLNTYIAAKAVVEGVLRLVGRLGALRNVFYDMQVPAGAKITAPPPSPPATP